jgi:hypothetical protein
VLGPLIICHKPACGESPGSEPLNVTQLPLQPVVKFEPALMVDGLTTLILTVSLREQAGLEIVHISGFTPAVVAVAVVVALPADATVMPVVLRGITQAPVCPEGGAFADKVTDCGVQIC